MNLTTLVFFLVNMNALHSSEDTDSDDEGTLVMSRTLPNALQRHSVRRNIPADETVILKTSRLTPGVLMGDDRPITPMKDRLVYNKEHSSLDFKDGE